MTTNKQRKEHAQKLLVEKLAKEEQKAKLQKLILTSISILMAVVLVATGTYMFFKKRSERIEAAKWTNCEYYKTDPSTNRLAKKTVLPDSKASNQHQLPLKLVVHSGNLTKTLTGYLDQKLSPCAVNALVSLTSQKYYQHTFCHRLAIVDSKESPMHIVQCGDPTASGQGGPGYAYGEEYPVVGSKVADLKEEYQALQEKQASKEITNKEFNEQSNKLNEEYNKELKSYYSVGTIAMAKSSSPNTTTAQFFIVYDQTILPADYTIVGKIDQNSIATLQTMLKPGVANPKTKAQPGEPLINDGKPKVPVEIVDFNINTAS